MRKGEGKGREGEENKLIRGRGGKGKEEGKKRKSIIIRDALMRQNT